MFHVLRGRGVAPFSIPRRKPEFQAGRGEGCTCSPRHRPAFDNNGNVDDPNFESQCDSAPRYPRQECERMNLLVGEIVRTLTDLCLAFKVTQR